MILQGGLLPITVLLLIISSANCLLVRHRRDTSDQTQFPEYVTSSSEPLDDDSWDGVLPDSQMYRLHSDEVSDFGTPLEGPIEVRKRTRHAERNVEEPFSDSSFDQPMKDHLQDQIVSQENLNKLFSPEFQGASQKKHVSNILVVKDRKRKSTSRVDKGQAFKNDLQSALDASEVTVKVKRSIMEVPAAKSNAEPEPVAELLASPLGKTVMQLELLETEVWHLKKALDAATRAQVSQNNPEIIVEELDSINSAREVELLLGKLRNPQQEYPLEKREKKNDQDAQKAVAPYSDICPAVNYFADGCRGVIGAFNLIMDNEAKSECDRHRLCYACADSSSDSLAACDQLFAVRSTALCNAQSDAETCQREIRDLLIVMSSVHRPAPPEADALRLEICAKPCIAEFLTS